MFVYITLRLDTRAVTSGLEVAWDYFGGIREILTVDNLTPMMDKADQYCPRAGKTFLKYAQTLRFIVDPTNSGHAQRKPILKNNVSYIKGNFFKEETLSLLMAILDPIIWGAIVLWILYAKRKTKSLKIWAIVCSSIAGLFHFV